MNREKFVHLLSVIFHFKAVVLLAAKRKIGIPTCQTTFSFVHFELFGNFLPRMAKRGRLLANRETRFV